MEPCGDQYKTMKIPFPKNDKKYSQINRSNILGNIWSSSNLDLQTNLGAIRVSPRLKLNTSTNEAPTLGLPVAYKFFDNAMFAICGTRVFVVIGTGGPSDGAFSEDASANAQTDYSADESDMQIFGGVLTTTTTDAVMTKDTAVGAWTSRAVVNPGGPHMLNYFKKFDRMYFTELFSQVRSMSTTYVVATPGSDYAIQLGSSASNIITCLKSTSQNMWIGTLNADQKGGRGRLFQWDGISQQVTAEYFTDNSMGVVAMVVDPVNDVPYVMDTNGVLSVFNGAGLTEVARLPFGQGTYMPWGAADPDNAERFIHPNGMFFTKNGTIRMLINNRANVSTNGTIENIPSGIWEWSRETGLVHMEPFTYTQSDTGTTITDFGQNQVEQVGALESMQVPSSLSVGQGTMLAGAKYYTNATSTFFGIFFDNSKDDIQKKGYLVSTWFESSEIASAWDDIWMSYRQFLNSTDNIVPKYRITEADSTFGTITWVDTTHFTILNSAVNVSNYWTSGTGGEVEILRGTGSGACVHITNAVNTAGTWTVTIDDAVTGVTTGTAVARFQNWIKLFPREPLSQVSSWNQWSVNTDSTPRVQFKICFTLTGPDEFYKAIITSNEDITTKQ